MRFYTTLLLKDLLNDLPLESVSNFYDLSVGEI
jgi:DNA polymerase theta